MAEFILQGSLQIFVVKNEILCLSFLFYLDSSLTLICVKKQTGLSTLSVSDFSILSFLLPQVTVQVENVNEPPQFSKPLYQASIVSIAVYKTPVVTVKVKTHPATINLLLLENILIPRNTNCNKTDKNISSVLYESSADKQE